MINFSDIESTIGFFRNELALFSRDFEAFRHIKFSNSAEDIESRVDYLGNLLYANNLLIITLLDLRTKLSMFIETSGNYQLSMSIRLYETEIKEQLLHLRSVNYSTSQLLNSATEIYKVKVSKYSSVYQKS